MSLVTRWLCQGVKWKLIHKTYPYLFTYKNIAKAHPQQCVRTVVEFHLLPLCSSPGMHTTKRKFILQRTAKKFCCHCTCLQIHYLTRSHVQRFDIDKCIICQVEKCKRGKGARSREALTQNISEYGSAFLLRAAEIRGDNRVLPQIKGQDCIAREIKYHRSC